MAKKKWFFFFISLAISFGNRFSHWWLPLLAFQKLCQENNISNPLTLRSTSIYPSVINATFKKSCVRSLWMIPLLNASVNWGVHLKTIKLIPWLRSVSLIDFLKLFFEVPCFWTWLSILFQRRGPRDDVVNFILRCGKMFWLNLVGYWWLIPVNRSWNT